MDAIPTPPAATEVTQLLQRWRGGERRALDALVATVYDELRRLARARLRNEQAGHTLDTTGLVHEAYLRLLDVRSVAWTDRNHFFSVASRTMRRLLVDHARKRRAQKRDPGGAAMADEWLVVEEEPAQGVIELDHALDRLEKEHPRQARAVELHYFGGFTQTEIGEILEVSQPTVARDLRFAIAWLGCHWDD